MINIQVLQNSIKNLFEYILLKIEKNKNCKTKCIHPLWQLIFIENQSWRSHVTPEKAVGRQREDTPRR